MKTILSCIILSCAVFCISCGSDDPPPTHTVRTIHYVPAKPKPQPAGPEAFEPVKRF